MLIRLVAILALLIAAVKGARATAAHRRAKQPEAEFVLRLTTPCEEDSAAEMTFERPHQNPPWTCWCNAQCIFEGGKDAMPVWVHKGNGGEPATGAEIAQAIADAYAGNYDE